VSIYLPKVTLESITSIAQAFQEQFRLNLGKGSEQPTMNLLGTEDDVLSLDRIRATLIRLEDTIIFCDVVVFSDEDASKTARLKTAAGSGLRHT